MIGSDREDWRLGFELEGTLRQLYKRAHQAHYVDNHVMGLLLT